MSDYTSIGFDLGPIHEFKQYAYDGLVNAGFLFQAMAGHMPGGMDDPIQALHYLAIILAFIGGFILIINRACHNLMTLISWAALFLICIIGPREYEPFFQDVSDKSQPTITHIGFTPQIIIIDFFSKVHRAIYNALFEYQYHSPSGSKTFIRNYVHELSMSEGLGIPEKTSFEAENNVRKLMTAYGFFCRNADANPYEAAYIPFTNKAFQKSFKTLRDSPWKVKFPNNRRVDMSMRSQKPQDLQQTYFTLKDLMDYVIAYTQRGFSGPPPFGAYFKDKDSALAMLNHAGPVSETQSENLDLIYHTFQNSIGKNISALNRVMISQKRKELLFDLDSAKSLTFASLSSLPTDFDLKSNRPFVDRGPDNDQYAFGVNDTYTQQDTVYSTLRDAQEASLWVSNRKEGVHGNALSSRILKDIKNFPSTEELNAYTNLFEQESPAQLLPVQLIFMFKPNTEAIAQRLDKAARFNGKINQFIAVENCAQLHQVTYQEAAQHVVLSSGLPIELLSKTHFKNLLIGKNNYHAGNYMLFREHIEELKALPGTRGKFFAFIDGYIDRKFKLPTSDENDLDDRATYIFDSLSFDGSDASIKVSFVEYLRQHILSEAIFRVLSQSPEMYAPINPSLALEDRAMGQQFSEKTVADKFSTIVGMFEGAADWVTKLGAYVDSIFAGAEAIFYTLLIKKIVGFALFVALLATPLLFLAGLANPTQATGVIVNTLLFVAVLKMVPVTFSLVDFSVSFLQHKSVLFKGSVLSTEDSDSINSAILIYATAMAYTSLVGASLFILFKAGDTNLIMSQITGLDKQANDAAKQLTDVTKGLAVAAAGLVAAGATGGASALIGGASAKGAAMGALKAGGQSALNTMGKLTGSSNAAFAFDAIATGVTTSGDSRKQVAKSDFQSKKIDDYLDHIEGDKNDIFQRAKASWDLHTDAIKSDARSEVDKEFDKAASEIGKRKAKEDISKLKEGKEYNSVTHKIDVATADNKNKVLNHIGEEKAYEERVAALQAAGYDWTPDKIQMFFAQQSAMVDLAQKSGVVNAFGEKLGNDPDYFAKLLTESAIANQNKMNRNSSRDASVAYANDHKKMIDEAGAALLAEMGQNAANKQATPNSKLINEKTGQQSDDIKNENHKDLYGKASTGFLNSQLKQNGVNISHGDLLKVSGENGLGHFLKAMQAGNANYNEIMSLSAFKPLKTALESSGAMSDKAFSALNQGRMPEKINQMNISYSSIPKKLTAYKKATKALNKAGMGVGHGESINMPQIMQSALNDIISGKAKATSGAEKQTMANIKNKFLNDPNIQDFIKQASQEQIGFSEMKEKQRVLERNS